mmetsp:Transcript_82510/g.145624  ORF Transcript_82510/g.145624 Transcript_82510/m.145624 type:complete len:966 (-) Transcript_82510:569-3466(-)
MPGCLDVLAESPCNANAGSVKACDSGEMMCTVSTPSTASCSSHDNGSRRSLSSDFDSEFNSEAPHIALHSEDAKLGPSQRRWSGCLKLPPPPQASAMSQGLTDLARSAADAAKRCRSAKPKGRQSRRRRRRSLSCLPCCGRVPFSPSKDSEESADAPRDSEHPVPESGEGDMYEGNGESDRTRNQTADCQSSTLAKRSTEVVIQMAASTPLPKGRSQAADLLSRREIYTQAGLPTGALLSACHRAELSMLREQSHASSGPHAAQTSCDKEVQASPETLSQEIESTPQEEAIGPVEDERSQENLPCPPRAQRAPKARAKAPGPAPAPKARAKDHRVEGSKFEQALPSWLGPKPPEDWKAERVVNWQPIRNFSRWQGSVWNKVHEEMTKEGLEGLAPEDLARTFGSHGDKSRTRPRQPSRQPSRSARQLPPKLALTADLLHARLLRAGIHGPEQIKWFNAGEEGQELSLDVLEALSGLLSLGGNLQGLEENLPPAEDFLFRTLQAGGPGMSARVSLALEMAKFKEESDLLEQRLELSLSAIRAVLDSRAMPQLLQGVLVLGNFVNSSSKSLGGAVGVSLESLAKLAHTRCLETRGKPQENALYFLLCKLQAKLPGLAEALAKDLDACLQVEDMDMKALAMALQSFQNLLLKLEESETVKEAVAVPAFTPARLSDFCDNAKPKIAGLTRLLAELGSATAELQQYFAEPHGTSLQEMLRNLADLRRAMPSKRLQCRASPFPPYPKPCHLRHITGKVEQSEPLEPKRKVRPSSQPCHRPRSSQTRYRSCPAALGQLPPRHMEESSGCEEISQQSEQSRRALVFQDAPQPSLQSPQEQELEEETVLIEDEECQAEESLELPEDRTRPDQISNTEVDADKVTLQDPPKEVVIQPLPPPPMPHTPPARVTQPQPPPRWGSLETPPTQFQTPPKLKGSNLRPLPPAPMAVKQCSAPRAPTALPPVHSYLVLTNI